MPMREAAPLGDIFVTTTGCREVIGAADLSRLRDGAILANAGHFDVEIDKAALNRLAEPAGSPRANIEEYRFPDGRRIYLLAEGRLVNLAAGDGHPAEIMDLSFALQFLAMDYLRRSEGLPQAVLPLPAELDREVARLKLSAMGIAIDSLTESQRAYLGLH